MLASMIWPVREEAQIVLFVDDAAIEADLSGHRKISSYLRHSRFYEIKIHSWVYPKYPAQ